MFMLSEIHKALLLFFIGVCAAPNPALTFFFFFAKKRKRMSAKKKKHANFLRCFATQRPNGFS